MTVLWDQIRYQLKVFLRSPVAVFFTVMLPLIMLVLFNALFANSVDIDGGNGETWPLQQFYVGGLAAFSAVSSTFTNLANMVPIRRDEGILKRWRSTPLPPWAAIGGFVGSAMIVAFAAVAVMWTIGIAAYGIELDVAKLPVAVITFVIAVGAFAALGLAVASLISTAEAAPAVANAVILPLGFISDVFIQQDDPPRWLSVVGDIFPLKPFAETFQDTFNPFVDAPAFEWDRLVRIAAWGIIGTVIAVRYFRWEPTRKAGRSRRRRSATV